MKNLIAKQNKTQLCKSHIGHLWTKIFKFVKNTKNPCQKCLPLAYRAVTSENVPPYMCAQGRLRLACAFAQSDQNSPGCILDSK